MKQLQLLMMAIAGAAVIEQSLDEGKIWQVWFDGTYKKKLKMNVEK